MSYPRLEGRWVIGPHSGMVATGHPLHRNDVAMESPILMVGADGNGAAVNCEGYHGKWDVMSMPLGFSPVLSRPKNSRTLNYYYHDYVGKLTIDPLAGTCVYTHRKRRKA